MTKTKAYLKKEWLRKDKDTNRHYSLFYNPVGSYMAESYTEGRENVNVVDFYGRGTSEETGFLITDEDPLFTALKTLITLHNAAEKVIGGSKHHTPYLELTIPFADYLDLLEAYHG